MAGINQILQSNSKFWHSIRYMKLYKNKKKGEFTKKINDNDFSGFTLYKKDL